METEGRGDEVGRIKKFSVEHGFGENRTETALKLPACATDFATS